MKMNVRIQLEYVRSTETEDPKILVKFQFTLFQLLKLLFCRYLQVQHCFSDVEIEELSRIIIKWRTVKNFREYRRLLKK